MENTHQVARGAVNQLITFPPHVGNKERRFEMEQGYTFSKHTHSDTLSIARFNIFEVP